VETQTKLFKLALFTQINLQKFPVGDKHKTSHPNWEQQLYGLASKTALLKHNCNIITVIALNHQWTSMEYI
jgi:hypothetical protein